MCIMHKNALKFKNKSGQKGANGKPKSQFSKIDEKTCFLVNLGKFKAKKLNLTALIGRLKIYHNYFTNYFPKLFQSV